MLISEQYRQLQHQLHETSRYGLASANYADMLSKIINHHQIKELLDYGAGSRLTLKSSLEKLNKIRHSYTYSPYEPAVEIYSRNPVPHEMVVCIDVLEHIEPEYLNNVLDDLARLTRRIGFFTIATIPAQKILADGRNAHLIQEPAEWWLPRITSRFTLHSFQLEKNGFLVVVSPKKEHSDKDSRNALDIFQPYPADTIKQRNIFKRGLRKLGNILRF